MFKVPEKWRITTGRVASDATWGTSGAFRVPVGTGYLYVIVSDGEGWEHVSVSHTSHIPTWDEMCAIKDLFWDDEDVVIQYHPRKSEYVTNCKNCLHLWRPTTGEIPTPDPWLVGNVKDKRIR